MEKTNPTNLPFRMRSAMLAGLLVVASQPVWAIAIVPTSDAFGLANTLFQNTTLLQVNGASYSGEFGQAGTYTNFSGTYGLPVSGIVLSSGAVENYADGPDTVNGFTTDFMTTATAAQNSLLSPITGQSSHFDVSQLDISFFNNSLNTTATFFATFGSEEFPDFVGSPFVDGFGLYVNGQNVAGVASSNGIAGLPVNINHPDMTPLPGTELNAVLAPNGNPVLRFDVPINPAAQNDFTIIIADANDSALDTTVYLSSFFTQGPGNTPGSSEFNPLLPSNPPDPLTGEFVIELPAAPAGTTLWVDPPVAVGYEYEAPVGNFFDTVTAPSLATVADLDGYLLTVGGVTIPILAGQVLDFFTEFGVNPTSFLLEGIDPALMLDPTNPLAFPIGVSFVNATSAVDTVSVTPITDNGMNGGGGGGNGTVPLPATLFLMFLGLAAIKLHARAPLAPDASA
ncbi:MAG: choice-of-anchor L domain-containing protein [Gammaproteobacteria bacterium]|nr:choice-of-anchor L domain-containing protein [Gammaproteobacteria bacterium]